MLRAQRYHFNSKADTGAEEALDELLPPPAFPYVVKVGTAHAGCVLVLWQSRPLEPFVCVVCGAVQLLKVVRPVGRDQRP